MVLRYAPRPDVTDDHLDRALDAIRAVKGVSDVSASRHFRSVTLTFEDKRDRLAELEQVSVAAGCPLYLLSHGRVRVVLTKPLETFKPEVLRDMLATLRGVLAVEITTSGYLVHGDLRLLRGDQILTEVAKVGAKATLDGSTRFVVGEVLEGEARPWVKAVAGLQGVLDVQDMGDNRYGVWFDRRSLAPPSTGEQVSSSPLQLVSDKVQGLKIRFKSE